MSDNLFEQLFELFQSPGPVNWKVAREVTKSLAGDPEPVEPKVAEEYQELASAAQLRLSDGLNLPTPPIGELQPTDRATWAAENQQAFRILIEPLADKLGGIGDEAESGQMTNLLQPLGPALLGVQAGTMVGFMSHRVLGQFDVGIPAMDHDRPYLVVPNVEDFAAMNGIESHQVRLWATLHEMAFHAEMEVEWLRGHFVSLMTDFYETVQFDIAGLMDKLGSLDDPARLEEMLGEGSEQGHFLLRGEPDPGALEQIQAFTAFLEGYGDHAVAIAGGPILDELDRLAEAYTRRRAEPNEAEQFLQQLAGLDLQRHRARDGYEFCREVSRRWGSDALDRVWEDPQHLPILGELTDPVGWAARILLT